jgi:hypothetical protein
VHPSEPHSFPSQLGTQVLVQTLGDAVLHVHPLSTAQLEEQPSPELVSPSSHFSAPSFIPFPHTALQSLSFNALHPVGQHTSFDLHAVIIGYAHLFPEHTLDVHLPPFVH